MNIDFNSNDFNKEFTRLFADYLFMGLSPRDAIETLRYNIFVRHNHWFESLSEERQWEVRGVLKSLELVHLN